LASSKSFIDLTPANSGQKLDAPPACPKCRSTDTSSAAKRPTSQSYWRCMDCGEVWNPSLLSSSTQRWWQK
jgi:transposase-like protein